MALVPFEARETKIKAAIAWLQASMAGQPRKAAEMEAQGIARGFSHGTLVEARRRARIRSEKHADGWYWMPRVKQGTA